MVVQTRLSKRSIDALKPKTKPYVVFDGESTLPGFGVRVMPSGFKSFFLSYRPKGRDGLARRDAPKKRIAIGAYGPVTADQARDKALALLASIRAGGDPQAEKTHSRDALTVASLIDAFERQHVAVHCKATTATAHHMALGRLRQAHGSLPAVDLTRGHVDAIHQAMATTPYAANRFLAVVSSAFVWAGRQGLVPRDQASPASGIKRFKEKSRERFLSTDELARIGGALRDAGIDPFAVAAIRLLILTGARLREILHAKWEHVDLERGLIFLPESKTGKKTLFLNEPAMAVLSALPRFEGNPHIIPGRCTGQPRADLGRPWDAVTKAAGLDGLRIHDLRHSFASIGAGSSLGLPIIGKLLGHSQAATTQRYAHLASDPMRAAANVIGSAIASAMGEK